MSFATLQPVKQSSSPVKSIRILHLEDDPNDAFLAESAMRKSGVAFEIIRASNAIEYATALIANRFDLILSDNGIPGFGGMAALEKRLQFPDVPFVFLSASGDDDIRGKLQAGATDSISKNSLWRLEITVRQIALARRQSETIERKLKSMTRLVEAVQDFHEMIRFADHFARLGDDK
jgi:CheY-like chemotaxis protein